MQKCSLKVISVFCIILYTFSYKPSMIFDHNYFPNHIFAYSVYQVVCYGKMTFLKNENNIMGKQTKAKNTRWAK